MMMQKNQRSSLFFLIAANIYPLLGVIFFGWSVFSIVMLYWAESAVIGAYNILKMILSADRKNWPMLVMMVPFFTVHYGGFMLGHLVFIFAFFAGGFSNAGIETLSKTALEIFYGVVLLFISHGYSFYANFLKGGEKRGRTPHEQMFMPYGRITIMHITIIFGGALYMMLGRGEGLLFLLIIGKTVADIRGHMREHSRRAKD